MPTVVEAVCHHLCVVATSGDGVPRQDLQPVNALAAIVADTQKKTRAVAHGQAVGKERTSVVSTPSLAELYRVSHELLVGEEEEKVKEQGRQEDKEVESGDQGEETTLTWMAMMMVVSEVRTRLELQPM